MNPTLRWDKMSERKIKHHTINLSLVIADKINEVVASEKHGYGTVPEFVREATRKYLRELGYLQ